MCNIKPQYALFGKKLFGLHAHPVRQLIFYITRPSLRITDSGLEAYLEPWYIENPGVLRTRSQFRTSGISRILTYPEPWHIPNPGMLRTLTYSEPKACAEPWHIHNPVIFRTLLYLEPRYIQNLRHMQNPGIFQTLVCWEPDIFKTLAYWEPETCSEPWRIQNPRHTQNQRHIQNSGIFRIHSYSEPCQTSMMEGFAKIVNSYAYFHNISFSRSPLHETKYFDFF